MSNTYTQFQILRGDSASNAAYVGRPGELTADMENKILRLHDGTTPGGTIIGSGSGGGGGGVTFPYTGNAVITGSLWVSGSYNGFSGITGSLLGTASYAETTITASYISGGIYIPEGLIITGSTYITGTLEVTNGITGSLLGTASRAIIAENVDVLNGGSATGLGIYSGSFYGTASQAITASYALNAGSGGGSGFPFSGSAIITGSLLISSSGIYLSGSGLTGSVLGTSSWANDALTAVSSSRSISTEKIDVLSGGSTTGLGIYSGSFYGTASQAITASYAINAGAGSGFPFSGNAVITGSLLISSSGIYLSGSGLTGSVLGTSSWAISSSRSISTEKVDVISGGSTTGLGIYSGSFFGTSSWAVSASYAVNSGQGVGFPFSGSAVITGSLLISSSGIYLSGSGLTGSVLGTSSWANNAVSSSVAEKVDVISGGSTTGLGIYSGSFFGTSSWALNAVNAGAGSGFPFSGSAVITGSLLISSSGIYLSGSGLTGSVLGTSSWASNSVSSSRSISTEKVDVLSGGSTTGLGVYSGSFFGTSSWAVSASYAVNSGQGVGFPFSGSAVITGSLLISSSGLYLSGSGVTGSLLGTASNAVSSSYAFTASRAISASRADSSEKIDVLSGGSTTGLGVYSGSFFGTSSWAVSASYAVNSGTGTVGPGTVNRIALFSSSTAISSSNIFQSSNNIGIGTTSPITKLHVYDGSARNFLVTSDALQQGSTGIAIGSFNDNASAYAPLSIVGSVIFFNNNVGIGTINPTSKLQIVGDAQVSGSSGIFSVADRSTTGTGGFYRSAGINRLWDSTFGDVIAWNTSGNVGVGTTNPVTKLHIQGNVSASSYTSSISNAVGYFGTASWAVSASRGVTTEKVDVLSGGSTTGLGTYSGSFYGTSMIVSGGQAYTIRYDVGNQATTYTVNWNNGNHQSVNLTANTQLSFSNGQPGGAYSLELRPTGTYSASWPSSVKWPSNSEPTQTKSSTKKDIFTFYYDGTVYNGQVFGFDYALS